MSMSMSKSMSMSMSKSMSMSMSIPDLEVSRKRRPCTRLLGDARVDHHVWERGAEVCQKRVEGVRVG